MPHFLLQSRLARQSQAVDPQNELQARPEPRISRPARAISTPQISPAKAPLSVYGALSLIQRVHSAGQWSRPVKRGVAAIEMLMSISIDLPPQAYVVAILHAILEDTDMSFEELKAPAGDAVARRVLSLTSEERRNRALYSSSEEEIIRVREYVEAEPWMLILFAIKRSLDIRLN